MYCKKCGSKLEKNETKCPNCGETLDEAKTNQLTETEKEEIINLEKFFKISNCILYSIFTFAICKIFLEYICGAFLSTLIFKILKVFDLDKAFNYTLDEFPFGTYFIIFCIAYILIRILDYYVKTKIKKYGTKYSVFGKHTVNKTIYLATLNVLGIFGGQYFLIHEHKKGIFINFLWISMCLFILIAFKIPGKISLIAIRTTYIVLGIICGLIRSNNILVKMKVANKDGNVMIN